MSQSDFQFEISLSVLNHLGRNLYRNFITVLGEAISNSWDADANNVWIEFDKENTTFSIKDDGIGMTSDDFQNKFLKIGYSKRKEGATKTAHGRPFIGAKGIGKLALLSCAERISIFSKTKTTDYVGGVINNSELDQAIKDDLTSNEYPLESIDLKKIAKLSNGHSKGTIIVFEDTKEIIWNSKDHIKKLLAMSFKFSLLDAAFNIFVNGDKVTIEDLKDLMDATQYLWRINHYSDDYVNGLPALKADSAKIKTTIDLKGFVATVTKPGQLKIRGTKERATIDLFVNGRLREKNIIRHIPTQRIVESYMYGQIHFNAMDKEGVDPFTSSREGVLEDDKNFLSLLDFLKKKVLQKIFEEWDKLRLDQGDKGDDENPRKSKKDRHALGLYSAAKEDFKPDADAPGKEQVENWMNDLQPDAEFNLSAYVDCFLSENLVRKFMQDQSIDIKETVRPDLQKLKNAEEKNKRNANISFQICKDGDDLRYLGMDDLAISVEGSKNANKTPTLWTHAVSFKPVRNVVGHTGVLSEVAKKHLNATFENIKARVVDLISKNNK